MTLPDYAIEAENLVKTYPATKTTPEMKAIKGIDLKIPRGSIFGLLGPNGAGKTSLFNMVAGVIRPDAGKVVFEGADITRLAPAQRCRAGIGRCFQIP